MSYGGARLPRLPDEWAPVTNRVPGVFHLKAEQLVDTGAPARFTEDRRHTLCFRTVWDDCTAAAGLVERQGPQIAATLLAVFCHFFMVTLQPLVALERVMRVAEWARAELHDHCVRVTVVLSHLLFLLHEFVVFGDVHLEEVSGAEVMHEQ